MLKLSFISKNTRETDNTLEKSTKILYDAYIGSPGASLSCLRGYKSNMAPGTVKRAIGLLVFLQDRKQRVVVDGIVTDYLNINRGVPQGTVLGLYYFLS